LLSINGLLVRSSNQLFLKEVKTYFESLVSIINKHQQTPSNPNGSIILLQIENEYGFYGRDKSYIEAIRKIWIDLGVTCEQYYVDWVQNI
jgi:beta-galactosidase